METTYETIDDLTPYLPYLSVGERICVVEQSPDYPGQLAFQAVDQAGLVATYPDFLSRYCLLSELFLLDRLVESMTKDGWQVLFMDSAKEILDRVARWSNPLIVKDFGQDLYGFQQFILNRALDAESGLFFNCAMGSGKGSMAVAGAKELYDRGEIDLVIMFTIRKMKINTARRFTDLSPLTAEVIDGAKATRVKKYARTESQVLVMNYEKANFDLKELSSLVKGKRVLFIADEVQKILYGENGKPTKARKGIDKLIKLADKAIVWPMSGSIVKNSPLRYHDVFDVICDDNPLGTRKDFSDRYADDVDHYKINNWVTVKRYTWNMNSLADVRHRVWPHCQAVRKTDPGVREHFQDMTTEIVPVQLSVRDQRLYDTILADAKMAKEAGEATLPYYSLLRYVCNSSESLAHHDSDLARAYCELYPDLIDNNQSSKFELVCDYAEAIAEAGDQVVVFTSWTNLSLFLLARVLTKRGVRYVVHYGTGMTDAEAQHSQDLFKADPSITVFLSSDAGAMGLNMNNARYVISVESPYDPDLLQQRNDRIDRADSELTGLTAYVMVAQGTVEERIVATQERRREISESVQGTQEALTRESAVQMSESNAADSLMFGHDDHLS